MDPTTVPPTDPPTFASMGSAMPTNAPQNLPDKPISQSSPNRVSPLPQSGANIPTNTNAPSIVEPQIPAQEVNIAPAPQIPVSNPLNAVTTNTSPNSSNFNLFISILTGIVVLIWIGVGLIYYSNLQIETEMGNITQSTI